MTPEELNSPAWKKVRDWAQQELAQCRVNLEGDAAPEKTWKLRGSIRSLIRLLALGEPPAQAEDSADD